jgi:hypothetical protein
LFFHPAIFTEQAGFVKTFKNLLYGVLENYTNYYAKSIIRAYRLV